MIVLDTFFILLIIYLFVYCIYQLFFFIKASKIEQYFENLEKTRSNDIEQKKLCVIIYATHKDKNLDKLLEGLNKQSYNKENYQVHVAYKQDENDATSARDFVLGARFHNIQNPDYFSKDKAVELIIQKLIVEDNFDAYVFLGANRIVGEKYLENINKSIAKSSVTTGAKVSTTEKDQLAKKIKNSIISAHLKFSSRTNDVVRSLFNLPFFVDGDNFVITSDILKKIGYVGIEDKDSELRFTLDLISSGYIPSYSPYIISGIDVKNYDFSSVDIRTKISLFSYYFPILAFKDTTVKEFILFLLKPNSLFVCLSFLMLVYGAVYFPNHIMGKVVALLGVCLVIDFIIAIFTTKMSPQEVFWLSLYPVCLSWQKLKILINNLTMRSIIYSSYEEENVNSATINAIIDNGKKDVNCKLDLVSEDGMRKVVFREGNRFIVTDSHLRMYDALEDMTTKLSSKGMILKTCQNCQHFTLCPDGTLDCLNGKCQISQNEILVWNGCQYFHLHPAKKEQQ